MFHDKLKATIIVWIGSLAAIAAYLTYVYEAQDLGRLLLADMLLFGLMTFMFLPSSPKIASDPKRAATTDSLPDEFVAAASQGSDYYVPTPGELSAVLETNVTGHRNQQALILAHYLVDAYYQTISTTPQTSSCVSLEHRLIKDTNVLEVAKKILKKRGWSLTAYDDCKVFFSPAGLDSLAPPANIDASSIPASQDFAELIREKILKPVQQKALLFAQQMISRYKAELEASDKTSSTLHLEADAEVDYTIFDEASKILTQRDWTIRHVSGRTYAVYPGATRRTHRGPF